MKSQQRKQTRYFHRQPPRRDRGGDPHSHHQQQQMMMNSLFCDYPVPPGNVVPFHNHHHHHHLMQNSYSSQSQYSGSSSSSYLMPAYNNKGLKSRSSSSSGSCSTMGQYYAGASNSDGYSIKLPPPPPPMPCSIPRPPSKTSNYSSGGSSYPPTLSSNGYQSSSSTSYSSTPSVEQQQQKLQQESRPPSPPREPSPPEVPIIEEKQKQHINVTMDGLVQHLPQSMLSDQYGLAALLVGLQARKCIGPVPDSLCNEVLAEMNVALSAYPNEPLYQSLSGPLTVASEPKCFSTEQNGLGHTVCPEYQVTHRLIFESPETDMNQIRSTYALKFDKFSDDLLFFVFYTFTRDILQMVAAANLFQKGWRYHMEHKVWLQRVDSAVYVAVPETAGNPYQERGIYNCFDYISWKIVQMELNLDVGKLESAPKLPPEYFLPSSPKS